MIHSPVKPLSVNRAYQGRKIKTTMYKRYAKKVLAVLPDLEIPQDCELHLKLVVQYSNRRSDIDNCLKPFIDILQERYDFNDNRIFHLEIVKEIVDRGDDGIYFEVLEYEA